MQYATCVIPCGTVPSGEWEQEGWARASLHNVAKDPLSDAMGLNLHWYLGLICNLHPPLPVPWTVVYNKVMERGAVCPSGNTCHNLWDTKSRTWAEKNRKGQMACGEEGAGVLINLCMSGKLRAAGRIDCTFWVSSYFRDGQGCTRGFGVLCSLAGGGFGPNIKTGCEYSQRCTLTRMLAKINILPACISSVTKEVII